MGREQVRTRNLNPLVHPPHYSEVLFFASYISETSCGKSYSISSDRCGGQGGRGLMSREQGRHQTLMSGGDRGHTGASL